MRVERRVLVRPEQPQVVLEVRLPFMEAEVVGEVQQQLAVREVRACGEAVVGGAAAQRLEVRADHPFLEGAEELERRRMVAMECSQGVGVGVQARQPRQ